VIRCANMLYPSLLLNQQSMMKLGLCRLNHDDTLSRFDRLQYRNVTDRWRDTIAIINITRQHIAVVTRVNKLSCRRETAPWFVSLNISPSRSRSLELTPLSRPCVRSYQYITVTIYLVPFLRYSASNNGVTLKSALWVVRGHWKCRVHGQDEMKPHAHSLYRSIIILSCWYIISKRS